MSIIKKETYGVSGSKMTTHREEKFKELCIATKLARNNYIMVRDRAEKLYEELYGASPVENSDVYWNDHFIVTDGVSETPPDFVEIERSAILHTLILKK